MANHGNLLMTLLAICATRLTKWRLISTILKIVSPPNKRLPPSPQIALMLSRVSNVSIRPVQITGGKTAGH
jgi:hypothetical protein